MYLLKKPWTNHHKSDVLIDSTKIKYKKVYQINDISVTMLKEPFQNVNLSRKCIPISVFEYPDVTHTQMFVNKNKIFNTSNICIWEKRNDIINDTQYNTAGNIVKFGSMYGHFSLSQKYLNILNEQLASNSVNSLLLSFDSFKTNHIASTTVEINYDSID
jgi:hypothetical protein